MLIKGRKAKHKSVLAKAARSEIMSETGTNGIDTHPMTQRKRLKLGRIRIVVRQMPGEVQAALEPRKLDCAEMSA